MAGGKTFGGESSFMPLKLNTAGVIPPIFASSLLLLPATAGQIMLGVKMGASFRVFALASARRNIYHMCSHA